MTYVIHRQYPDVEKMDKITKKAFEECKKLENGDFASKLVDMGNIYDNNPNNDGDKDPNFLDYIGDLKKKNKIEVSLNPFKILMIQTPEPKQQQVAKEVFT